MAMCKSLAIDVSGIKSAINSVFVKAQEEAEEQWIAAMGAEIMSQGSGRPEWRELAAQSFNEISREMTDDFISLNFGLPENFDSYADMRSAQIQIALWGNQEHGPIMAKPGQQVFGSMGGQSRTDYYGDAHVSNATEAYPIPQFDQSSDADAMMENAKKKTRAIFYKAIENAWNSLNFNDFVYVV